MKRFALKLFAFLLAGVIYGLFFTDSRADSQGCSDAVDSYNSAIGEIGGRLKRYGNCLAASQGHDDCSSEFRRLKSLQNDFETAVSNFQAECQ